MSKMSKSRKRALTCVLSVMLFVCMLASSTFTAYAFSGAAAETKSGPSDAAEPAANGTRDNAPANITDADVAKMSIKFYANGISYNSEATASGLDYTIGELQGDDASGYSTTVTFRFVPGDAFETKVKGLIKNKASASWQGAWGYNFTSARPAEQTVKLQWNGTKWSARYANGSFAGNLPGGTAKVIIVELSLFRTVKYTDGVNGEAFPEQSYTVANGAATPAFNGIPVRAGYTFAGWDPEVAQKVTADAVYTAKWTEDAPPVVDKKPENITSADVEGMKIRVYAVGTESMGFSEMLSLTPALGAKGVAYTIGEVEKDANGDWYTTVTFRFASGDAFEAALRESLNTDSHLAALEGWDGWKGDWSYYFGEYTGSAANGAARAAEQTLRLKWISDGENSGHWQAVYENGTLAENNTAAVANIIKVNAVLPCTVKYTDGANGEVFADQVYNTYKGAATPSFTGTCEREDYAFAGWNPEVSAVVGGDTVYTAKWGKIVPDKPAKGTVLKDLFSFRCTADHTHTAQISNGGSYITYNNDVLFDQTRGVYIATAKITNVQALLSFGTKCPDKVWGKKHYHTDKDGATVRTELIRLVWKPTATGTNASGKEVTGLWMPDGEQFIDVWCATAPSAPTIGGSFRNYLGSTTAIRVIDSLDETKFEITYFRYLTEGTYSFGEVTKDENGDFWCELKIDPAAYAKKFNKKYTAEPAYRINTVKTTSNFVYKLKYIGDKVNYKQDGSGWTVDKSSYLEGETSKQGKILYVISGYAVKYTDGADGKYFPDQLYYVKPGDPTPAFEGTPTRANYDFAGWTPEPSQSVGGDITYTASWTVTAPSVPSGSNSNKSLFDFHCTVDDEHEDQTYNWFGSYVKYNGDMKYDQERGVYVATAQITNVQTLLAFGVNCPNKVWGKTHYHTDAQGNTVRTATISLVWDPDASGQNASGEETLGLWMPDGEQKVNVWCATAPSAPNIKNLTPRSMNTTAAIRVHDSALADTVTKGELVKYFKYLIDGTYTLGEVTKDANGDFWCELTITDLAPYVAEFNKNNPGEPEYRIDTAKTTAVFTFHLKYVGDKDYKQDGTGWTVDKSSYAANEKSAKGKYLYVARQYSITYTDGVDDEEIFPDQIHYAKPGDATPAFSGTPKRTNYDFVGWEPEVAETVTQNAVYKAVWTPSTKNKPKNITKTAVDKMNIRAYAEGTETFNPGGEMSSCAPTIKAKGVKYVIGEVEGNDVIGYTTTVTFYFISGDKFEAAARDVFNTNKAFGGSTSDKNWPLWKGDWSYSFNEARPAEQTLTLYWGKYQGRNSWTTLINGKPTGNITSAIANFIKVNLKLERTVKYVDGVNGEAFEEQSYTVLNGAETPAFDGTPTREGYTFAGWEPTTAQTVYEDATYTAKWTANSYTLVRDSNGGAKLEDVDVVYGTPYGDVIISSARAGYTEDGWYLVTEAGVSDIRIDAESVVSIAGKHTIFLKRSIAPASVSITADRESGVFDGTGRTLTAVHDEYEGLVYSYQWYKDGVLIEGANGKTLSIAGNVSDSGNYSVVLSVTNAENSAVITENEKVIANAAITVTVEKADNTLIYNYNGADAPEASDTTKESSITVDGAKEITREGYTFIGWNTASDGSGESYNAQDEYVFAQDNGNGMVSATLYAQWKANEYSITFNAEDATLSFTEKTVIYGEKVGQFPTASRKGYKLVWKDEAGNTVDENTVYTVAGNSVYTGVWELDPSQDTSDTDTAVYMLMAAGSLVCLAAAYVLRRRREN